MQPDGALRALIGGRDYAREPVQPRDRRQAPARLVLQALRLPRRRSSAGLTPDTVRDDAPVTIKGWSAGELLARLSRRR